MGNAEASIPFALGAPFLRARFAAGAQAALPALIAKQLVELISTLWHRIKLHKERQEKLTSDLRGILNCVGPVYFHRDSGIHINCLCLDPRKYWNSTGS